MFLSNLREARFHAPPPLPPKSVVMKGDVAARINERLARRKKVEEKTGEMRRETIWGTSEGEIKVEKTSRLLGAQHR